MGGCFRANCDIANIFRTAAPNKLITLLAAQRWRCCCCGRACAGRCRCAARSLTRINSIVLPPPPVRGLQDTSILVGPGNKTSIFNLPPKIIRTSDLPESPMRADRIISTTLATLVVVLHVPLDGQVIPVVAHTALKHIAAF